MLETIYEMTEAQFYDIVNTATVLGVFIGIGIGAILVAVFSYLIVNQRKINFKRWMSDIPEADRIIMKGKLIEICQLINEIATKSNTKLFKSLHNDFCRLKSFLSLKCMQE